MKPVLLFLAYHAVLVLGLALPAAAVGVKLLGARARWASLALSLGALATFAVLGGWFLFDSVPHDPVAEQERGDLVPRDLVRQSVHQGAAADTLLTQEEGILLVAPPQD